MSVAVFFGNTHRSIQGNQWVNINNNIETVISFTNIILKKESKQLYSNNKVTTSPVKVNLKGIFIHLMNFHIMTTTI